MGGAGNGREERIDERIDSKMEGGLIRREKVVK